MALKELDLVSLRQGLSAHGLLSGDVGTVVLVHPGGQAYEVEFVAADGRTIAVETLEPSDIEPVTGHKILHVRELPAA